MHTLYAAQRQIELKTILYLSISEMTKRKVKIKKLVVVGAAFVESGSEVSSPDGIFSGSLSSAVCVGTVQRLFKSV